MFNVLLQLYLAEMHQHFTDMHLFDDGQKRKYKVNLHCFNYRHKLHFFNNKMKIKISLAFVLGECLKMADSMI